MKKISLNLENKNIVITLVGMVFLVANLLALIKKLMSL